MLNTTPKADIINHTGFNPGPLYSLFHGEASDNGRVHISQGSAKGSHGGPACRNNDNFFHNISFNGLHPP